VVAILPIPTLGQRTLAAARQLALRALRHLTVALLSRGATQGGVMHKRIDLTDQCVTITITDADRRLRMLSSCDLGAFSRKDIARLLREIETETAESLYQQAVAAVGIEIERYGDRLIRH